MRVYIKKEVVHAGIAHYGHIQDILALDTGLDGYISHDSIETINYCLVQLLQTAWTGHSIGDSGHYVFSVNHLRIHHGSGGYQFAIGQVAEVTSHRGATDVYCQTIALFHKLWLYFDDLLVLPDGDGHLPIALAHNGL